VKGPSDRQLEQWRDDLALEIAEIAAQIHPLETRMKELQRRLQAVSLALPQNGKIPSTTPPIPARQSIGSRAKFTPVRTYWKPTLQALVEMGGAAPSHEVVKTVGEKLEFVLTEADREILPSGVDVRWKNRVAFQRENMKRQGLLRSDSPRGIWEITETGRKWLDDNV
jgi:restriction system protein